MNQQHDKIYNLYINAILDSNKITSNLLAKEIFKEQPDFNKFFSRIINSTQLFDNQSNFDQKATNYYDMTRILETILIDGFNFIDMEELEEPRNTTKITSVILGIDPELFKKLFKYKYLNLKNKKIVFVNQVLSNASFQNYKERQKEITSKEKLCIQDLEKLSSIYNNYFINVTYITSKAFSQSKEEPDNRYINAYKKILKHCGRLAERIIPSSNNSLHPFKLQESFDVTDEQALNFVNSNKRSNLDVIIRVNKLELQMLESVQDYTLEDLNKEVLSSYVE